MTFTEQVALRALEAALAKVMDAQGLCIEAGADGDEIVNNLLRAEFALVRAIRAMEGK